MNAYKTKDKDKNKYEVFWAGERLLSRVCLLEKKKFLSLCFTFCCLNTALFLTMLPPQPIAARAHFAEGIEGDNPPPSPLPCPPAVLTNICHSDGDAVSSDDCSNTSSSSCSSTSSSESSSESSSPEPSEEQVNDRALCFVCQFSRDLKNTFLHSPLNATN